MPELTPEVLAQAKAELERASPPPKPGYLTSEFWLSGAASVVGLYFAAGAPTGTWVDKAVGLAAVVLSALGYTVSRGMAKRPPK